MSTDEFGALELAEYLMAQLDEQGVKLLKAILKKGAALEAENAELKARTYDDKHTLEELITRRTDQEGQEMNLMIQAAEHKLHLAEKRIAELENKL